MTTNFKYSTIKGLDLNKLCQESKPTRQVIHATHKDVKATKDLKGSK